MGSSISFLGQILYPFRRSFRGKSFTRDPLLYDTQAGYPRDPFVARNKRERDRIRQVVAVSFVLVTWYMLSAIGLVVVSGEKT